MASYTPEQKAEAVKMVNATNIKQTSEKLHISPATLSKWKKEAGVVAPSRRGKKTKKTTNEQSTPLPEKSLTALIEEGKELLKEDSMAELIDENSRLRNKNAKLEHYIQNLLKRIESR